MKETRRKIEREIRKLEKEILFIGGNFNARKGKKGKKKSGEEVRNNRELKKNSKDKEINKEERELLELIEKKKWKIANGHMKGNEKGEVTQEGERNQ